MQHVQLRKVKMEEWGAHVYLNDDEQIVGVWSQPWQPPMGSGGAGYGHYPHEVFVAIAKKVS